MFEPESGLIVWETMVFVLFIVILRLYAWRPLLSALKNREASIRQAIEGAEEARRQAEALLQKTRADLLRGNEMRKTREKGLEISDHIKNSFLADAKIQVDRILSDNCNLIERSKILALKELRMYIGGLTVECATLILCDTLNGSKQDVLIDKTLHALPMNGGER